MSIEALNQMPRTVSFGSGEEKSGSGTGAGVVTGLVAGGAGAYVGGKYIGEAFTAPKILGLEADKFTKTFEKLKTSDTTVYDALVKARTDYAAAGTTADGAVNAIFSGAHANAAELTPADFLKAMNVENTITDKTALEKAIADMSKTEENSTLAKLQKAVKDAEALPDTETTKATQIQTAQDALNNHNKKLADYQSYKKVLDDAGTGSIKKETIKALEEAKVKNGAIAEAETSIKGLANGKLPKMFSNKWAIGVGVGALVLGGIIGSALFGGSKPAPAPQEQQA